MKRTAPGGRLPPPETRERDAGAVVVPAVTNVAPLRSFGRRGVRTVVVAAHANAPAFCSRYCDEAVVVPSPETDLDGYRDALLSLASRPVVRAIAPLHEADIYLLAKHADAFEEHLTVTWVPFETLRSVHDRYRLAEVATAAGVPVPRTQLLDEVDDWSPAQVVKPRYSLLTRGYDASLTSSEGIRSWSRQYVPPGAEPDREAIRDAMGHVPIVQSFVPIANEYGFGALYERGDPLATFQHEKHRDHSYAGGASVFRESVHVPAVESLGRTLLDHLGWHGVAEVQFMRDAETGELTLTEVNPRFWGSVACAIRSGADFPYYYWLLATGATTSISPGYERGIATHNLAGELRYLGSLRTDNPLVEKPAPSRALWTIASSLVAHPRFDSLSLSDPCPFARHLGNAVRRYALSPVGDGDGA